MSDSGEDKDLAYFRRFSQNKLVIAHLKINCLRDKFELLRVCYIACHACHAYLRVKNVPTFHFYVPTCQRRAIFQIGVPTCQKACQFFNYFSKEKMFQLWLTFANFKNTWAILENLSREAKNLKQNILTFACFSHAHHKSF